MDQKTIKKCICEDMWNGDVLVHFYECPLSTYSLEYKRLPWFKKIFKKNPINLIRDLK